MAIAYTPDKPGLYLLSSVYDIEVDGDPQISIKIVPAVGSLVIFPNGIIKQVTTVDDNYNSPTYLKVTYGDVLTSLPDPDLELINYGRDVLMLYYDKRQTPTRIVVDTKLRLCGSNTIGYRIIKTINNNRVVISASINLQGVIISEIIPVTSNGVDKSLIYGTGHTLFDITAGEVVTLELVDSAGVVTGEATLITKEATILNTLELSSNPIVGFDAECSQIDGDNWIMYVGQDIEELSIHPYISFADGTKRIVPVNNISCFMYGYEDINTALFGNTYPVVIKYYLGLDELSTINEEVDGTRFVTMTKNVLIGSKDIYSFTKISIIPIWNPGTSTYYVRFIGYTQVRNSVKDVTATRTYVTGFSFSATKYNIQQEIRIRVPYTNIDGEIIQHNQTIFLTLTAPGQLEPFLIRSTVDGVAYGSQNAMYERPAVLYDAALQKYFISSIRFPNTEALLRNFYHTATPPWLADTEIEPPTPTHFTFRDATSLRVLVPVPIAIDDYEEVFSLVSLTTPNAFVNGTIVMEWLRKVNGQYNILYGVPVEVFLSETGYIG